MINDFVAEYVQNNSERLIAELQEYLQQPSFAENDEGMREGVELTRDVLERRGITTKLLPSSGYPAILGQIAGDSTRTLLLYQHYDVLPPGDTKKWTFDPFSATLHDGKIFARGAADHKGSFMARVHAVEALLAEGSLPVTVKFLIEGEEELGSPHLLEVVQRFREDLSADAALYSGWWKDEENRARMNCGMRGGFVVRLTARGASHGLHVRHAALVPNAAWTLVCALGTLRNEEGHVLVRGFYDDVDTLTPQDEGALAKIPFNASTLLARLGLEGLRGDVDGIEAVRRQMFDPTITISNIMVGDGSEADIPCIAHADLVISLVPSQDPGNIMDKLNSHFRLNGIERVTVELKSPLTEPARIQLSEPIVGVVQEAAKDVYGEEPILYPLSSGTGPRYVFVNKLGVPMVADPGVGHDDQRDHGFDENIRVEDYLQGIRVMAGIISRFREVLLSPRSTVSGHK